MVPISIVGNRKHTILNRNGTVRARCGNKSAGGPGLRNLVVNTYVTQISEALFTTGPIGHGNEKYLVPLSTLATLERKSISDLSLQIKRQSTKQ